MQAHAMTNFIDTLLIATDVVMELGRANPALIAVLVIVGIVVSLGLHYLRAGVWIPFFINGDYRQSGANFCICLGGGEL